MVLADSASHIRVLAHWSFSRGQAGHIGKMIWKPCTSLFANFSLFCRPARLNAGHLSPSLTSLAGWQQGSATRIALAGESIQRAFSNTLGVCGALAERYHEKVLHSPGCHLPAEVLAASVVCFDLPRLLHPDLPSGPVPLQELRIINMWAHMRWSSVATLPDLKVLAQQYEKLLQHWRSFSISDRDLFWQLRSATVKFQNGGTAQVPASWLALGRRAVQSPVNLGSIRFLFEILSISF